jgi:hypothetical protein
MPYKLGKLAPKFNKKTLAFSKYLRADAPPLPPAKVYWEYRVPANAWQFFGNDTIGDCTCACIAHMLMLITAHTGEMVTPTLADVIGVYSAVTGYDPSQVQPDGSNPTDQGAAITDILAYWQATGIAGHKILGWAKIDQTNKIAMRTAIYLFGGIDIGINVPQSAMDQTNAGQPWDVVPNSPIVGGHSVPNFGDGADGETCVTWAQLQQMSNEFLSTYCDEAYAVVTQDWVDQKSGLAPSHLDVAALIADLALLKS